MFLYQSLEECTNHNHMKFRNQNKLRVGSQRQLMITPLISLPFDY